VVKSDGSGDRRACKGNTTKTLVSGVYKVAARIDMARLQTQVFETGLENGQRRGLRGC